MKATKPPSHLDATGKAYWSKYEHRTNEDQRDILVKLCEAFSVGEMAYRSLQEHGIVISNGDRLFPNPASNVWASAQLRISRYWGMLGFDKSELDEQFVDDILGDG